MKETYTWARTRQQGYQSFDGIKFTPMPAMSALGSSSPQLSGNIEQFIKSQGSNNNRTKISAG
jgi:hypothetical protein